MTIKPIVKMLKDYLVYDESYARYCKFLTKNTNHATTNDIAYEGL